MCSQVKNIQKMHLGAPGPCGVRLHLAASKLDRKDAGGLGKSDPFIYIYNDNGQMLTKDGPRYTFCLTSSILTHDFQASCVIQDGSHF